MTARPSAGGPRPGAPRPPAHARTSSRGDAGSVVRPGLHTPKDPAKDTGTASGGRVGARAAGARVMEASSPTPMHKLLPQRVLRACPPPSTPHVAAAGLQPSTSGLKVERRGRREQHPPSSLLPWHRSGGSPQGPRGPGSGPKPPAPLAAGAVGPRGGTRDFAEDARGAAAAAGERRGGEMPICGRRRKQRFLKQQLPARGTNHSFLQRLAHMESRALPRNQGSVFAKRHYLY